MEYFDDLKLIEQRINQESWAQDIYKQAREDADWWMENFSDSTDKISGWGHHNYCTECNSPLLFDINRPYDHICSVCGKNNQEERHHQVWVATYRNKAAGDLLKAALLYKLEGEKRYLDHIIRIVTFYADNYENFEVHGDWIAKGKIMWQSLAEAGFAMSLLSALEAVKEDLSEDFRGFVHKKLFRPLSEFVLAEPEKLVNILLRIRSSVAAAGLFCGDEDLYNRALEGEKGITALLERSVTRGGLWHEGSMHYHFYALQGITGFVHFSGLYNRKSEIIRDKILAMYKTPLRLCYEDLTFPNPNDGWPDIGIFSYVHQYELVNRLYPDPEFAWAVEECYARKLAKPNLTTLLYREDSPKVQAPEKNCLSLEEINFVMLRNSEVSVFLKYGYATPSHAHYDRMTIEIAQFSKDPSNVGYGSPLHGEWYRHGVAHNTVTVDGRSSQNFDPGSLDMYDPLTPKVRASAAEVYPGVDFIRKLIVEGTSIQDKFTVRSAEEHIYDWVFHALGEIHCSHTSEQAQIGFDTDGYQHLSEIKRIIHPEPGLRLEWRQKNRTLRLTIDEMEYDVYLFKGIGNPATEQWDGVILRKKGTEAQFAVTYEVIHTS